MMTLGTAPLSTILTGMMVLLWTLFCAAILAVLVLIGSPSPNVEGDWALFSAGFCLGALGLSMGGGLVASRWSFCLVIVIVSILLLVSSAVIHLDLMCWHGYALEDGCAFE
jgi:hypothetical protein